MGPAERRAARGMPVPGIGADLSGGPRLRHARAARGRAARDARHAASATAREPASGCSPSPSTTSPSGGRARPNWSGPATLAADPRLHHVVVTGGEETLPYADLDGPADRRAGAVAGHRRRGTARGSPRAAPTTSPGYGARQVLDAHPARLADLLMDRKRRHLVRPVAALAKADGFRRAGPSRTRVRRRPAAGPHAVPTAASRTLADRLLRSAGFDEPGGAGRSLARRADLGQTRARRALADRGGAR